MNTRLLIAISLLVAALLLSVGGYCLVGAAAEELLVAVEEAREDAYHGTAGASAEAAWALWERKRTLLAMLLMHHDVEKIDLAFGLLQEYADSRQIDKLYEVCCECAVLLDGVRTSEKPDLANIF